MSEVPLTLKTDLSKETIANIESWRSMTRGIVSGKEFDTALRYAVNRALDAARVMSEKVAKRAYSVNPERIKEATKPRKASGNSLTATLEFRGGRIPVLMWGGQQYPVTQTSEGLAVEFKKGGGGTVKSAFIAKVGKNPGAYIRKFRGKGSSALGIDELHGRFPLKKITGPAVVSMVGHDEEATKIMERAREILDKRIDQEIRRLLSK